MAIDNRPPWVLFTDKGKPVAVLPAMRPGEVFSVMGWTMADAEAVVRAANMAAPLLAAATNAYRWWESDGTRTDAHEVFGALGNAAGVEPLPDTLGRRIRHMFEHNDSEDTVALIYTEVDAALRAGEFAAVDALLAEDWSDLSAVCLLALLSITGAAKRLLKERAGFAVRVREQLTAMDPGRVDGLMRGLE